MWTDCHTNGNKVSDQPTRMTMDSSKMRIFRLPFDVLWIRLEMKGTDCEHSIVRDSDFGILLILTPMATTRTMTRTLRMYVRTIPIVVNCNYLWFDRVQV